MSMRPKSTAWDLPPRMLRRTKTLKNGTVWASFYYNGRDKKGKRVEIPLGRDLAEAKRKWAELEGQPSTDGVITMSTVFARYERDIIPQKATRTQRDNLIEIKTLARVFGDAAIDEITPQHIAQYRDDRGKKAKTRANRELALFSHIFNMAREWGYTARENPCRGVKRNKETPRSFYADDEVWNAVVKHAVPELVDAMQLAYQTGQRPADVLKMKWSDIKEGALEVQQGKTGKRLRILLSEGDVKTGLGKLLDDIKKHKTSGFFIVSTDKGSRLTQEMLRKRFDDARVEAGKEALNEKNIDLERRVHAFQFRDIRPKAASEMDLGRAQALLGHTKEQITRKVYQRVGATVRSTT